MRRSRTVGRAASAAWVTRAEASFLAHVSLEEIDDRISAGLLPHRRVGELVLVDLDVLAERGIQGSGRASDARPATSPDRTRPAEGVPGGIVPLAEVRADGLRPSRFRPRVAHVVAAVAGATAVALLAIQLTLFGGAPNDSPQVAAPRSAAPATSTPTPLPVGRDPFASPFDAPGTGDERGGVLVKPPGVVREGDAVTAAATVVNRSDARWLPPSEVTFVARDATGGVIARATTTVSLGPDGTETVIAPDLDVDPAAIAAIEAHIDPAPLRSGRYRAPAVSVEDADVTDGGKAIAGTLSVGRGARGRARLSCAVFDSLDELTSVSRTTVDLAGARGGRLRFWLTAQPATAGPYRASCSVS